jgi:uncharacterized repeat protein (TIGR01451 family)
MRKIPAAIFLTCTAAVAAFFYLHFVPAESPLDDEDGMKLEAEAGEGGDYSDYWIARATYPTGKFDAQWVVAAAETERQMAVQIPAGTKTYDRSKVPDSPLALQPGGFVPLGPMPENNTQQAFGHISGRSNVIRVDPTNTTPGSITVYSGTDGGGIWKTTNCCTPNTTWNVVTDVPEVSSMSISDIALDPSNHNVIYAGTGDLNFGSFSFGASGVLKSSDAGLNWQLLGADVFSPYYSGSFNAFPQYQAVGKVAVDPNNPNIVMAGTKTSLYLSYDAGSTWNGPCFTNPYAVPNNPASTTAQRQDVTGLIPVSNGDGTTRLYVAIGTRGSPTPVQPDLVNTGSNGVYKLAVIPASGCPAIGDWTLLNSGWPAGQGNGVAGATPIGRIEIAVAPSLSSRMYAEAEDTATKKINSFYRSDDSGTTWVKTSTGAGLNNNGSNPGCEGNSNNGGAQMWYDAGLTVDPNNPDRVWMSTIDATVSSDGGLNYFDVTCGYGSHTTTGNVGQALHVDHHARAFVGNDSTQFLLGSDGGVYYTANADAPVTTSTAKNTMSFIGLNDTINSIEFYFGDITSNFSGSPLPAIGAGAQDNGCSRVGFSGQSVGATLWTSNCSGDGTTTKIEPVKNGYWFNSSQNGALGRAGSAATPYYNTATGVFTGNFSTASANTGGTWGGDPVASIFAMSYNIYKWGVLDAPGSGCTTANGCNHMIAGTTRLWETIDATNPTVATMRSSWKARTPDLTKDSLNINFGSGLDIRSYINYVDYSFTDPTIAAVATNDGNVQIVFGLGTTVAANCPVTPPATDPNCANAVNVTDSNNVLPNRPIFGVRFDPTTPLVAYAAVGGFNPNTPGHPGHVFQITCTANCATFQWKDKTGNLPDIPAEQVMPNPNFPQQVFVGTDWGLYYTDDITQNSPQWFRFESFPHVMVWELVVDRGFTTLAAFTRSRGAWVWPLPNAVIGSSADVAVTNSGATTVTAGSNVAYTVKVRNNGPNTAGGVVLNDPLPAGLTLVSVTGDCLALPCALATLQPGDNRTTTVTFAVPAAYNVATAIANVVSVTSGVADDTPSNNSATATTAVTDRADLSLSMTGPSTAARGTNVTYTIALANAGPSTAHNVSVADVTPAGLVFVSNSGDCTSAFPCTFASLDPGVPKQITATFSVPLGYAAGPVTNIASVTTSDTDAVAGNNSAQVATTITDSADLAISQVGPSAAQAGNNVSYTLTVVNNGPSAASNVAVTDATPSGLSSVSVSGDCAAMPCTFASLAPSVPKHVTVTFGIPSNYAGGPIANIASVTATETDPVVGNNSAEADTTVTASADLAISQTGTGAVLAGGSVSYTITVTNNGPSTASSVEVDDSTPSGLSAGTVSGDCAAFPCNFATLAPGNIKTITVAYAVPPDYAGNQITNTASVTSATSDPNLSNNIASTNTTVGAGADLMLTAVASTTVPVGGRVTYTWTLTNNGPSTASGVQLNDTLAAGLVFAGNSGDCTTAFPCVFGTLQPGDMRTVTTTACVPANYNGNFLIMSSGAASASSADANMGNNSAAAYTSLLFDVIFADGFDTCP